jgi:hypothetical protein
MKATCEVETWEINGKEIGSGATVGGVRPAVIVETTLVHDGRVRIRIGDATATVTSQDMIRAIEAATRR